MFKGPPISPGSDDEAAAARERARGHFSNDGCGNTNGALLKGDYRNLVYSSRSKSREMLYW
jgi:hypothetical protein